MCPECRHASSINADPLIPFFLMLSLSCTSKYIHLPPQHPCQPVSNPWFTWILLRLTTVAICSVLGMMGGSWPVLWKRKPRFQSHPCLLFPFGPLPLEVVGTRHGGETGTDDAQAPGSEAFWEAVFILPSLPWLKDSIFLFSLLISTTKMCFCKHSLPGKNDRQQAPMWPPSAEGLCISTQHLDAKMNQDQANWISTCNCTVQSSKQHSFGGGGTEVWKKGGVTARRTQSLLFVRHAQPCSGFISVAFAPPQPSAAW
jgi:hypothetical protein